MLLPFSLRSARSLPLFINKKCLDFLLFSRRTPPFCGTIMAVGSCARRMRRYRVRLLLFFLFSPLTIFCHIFFLGNQKNRSQALALGESGEFECPLLFLLATTRHHHGPFSSKGRKNVDMGIILFDFPPISFSISLPAPLL